MVASSIMTLLICLLGGPGTAGQAQPVVDRFMRHFESSAGWPSNSARGIYHTSLGSCDHAMRSANLAVVDLPAYLARRKTWQLTPIAHMGTAAQKRYYLLVRKGSFATLAALAGKTLATTLAEHPRFLSRVVFDNKVDVAKHFKLVQTRRPLKGLRQVARGRADATLVDETVLAHIKQLPLEVKLVPIFSSRHLPGLTLVGLGNRTKPKLLADIKAALPKLCAGAGEQLCRTFGVSRFAAAKRATYQPLERAFGD